MSDVITTWVEEPMDIKLPGPIGKWTRQQIPHGELFYFFPLNHGFGLKLRKRDGLWRGCVYSWPLMVHYELEGTDHTDLAECKARTQSAAMHYFRGMAATVGKRL